MSVESKVGQITQNVSLAIAESVCSNLMPMLKNEMNLNNEQIMRIFMVAKSTVENTNLNAVGQYVSLFNEIKTETDSTVKKTRLFG